MKVGDLIRHKESNQIGIIVEMDMTFDQERTADEMSPYYRCLIHGDYIWLYERHLEVINEGR
tara:strand:+ start:1924 stop:2109 length:186 start_codon:yes stop_codon:yes gene_type:complete